MYEPKKPIEESFRLAGELVAGTWRFANEWRDTGCYLFIVSVGVADYALSGKVHIALPLGLVFAREFTRFIAWHLYAMRPPPRLVGDTRPVPNPKRYACAAGFVASSIMAGYTVPTMASYLTVLVPLLIEPGATGLLEKTVLAVLPIITTQQISMPVTQYVAAGQLRGIIKSYKEMWDWPRKGGDGGGTTQTCKINNTFIRMGQFMGTRPAAVPLRSQKVKTPQFLNIPNAK